MTTPDLTSIRDANPHTERFPLGHAPEPLQSKTRHLEYLLTQHPAMNHVPESYYHHRVAWIYLRPRWPRLTASLHVVEEGIPVYELLNIIVHRTVDWETDYVLKKHSTDTVHRD